MKTTNENRLLDEKSAKSQNETPGDTQFLRFELIQLLDNGMSDN